MGGYTGGRPPFGYEAKGGALWPREDESEVVRWIFREVAEGRSIRQVAAALNEAGTLGRRRWFPSEVGRILSRVDYKTGVGESRVVDPRVWNRAQAQLAGRRRG